MKLVRKNDQAGFTIPELLVVIVIIGILLAIAIPSFLGARKDGQDSQAHGALRAGLAAERTRYVDYQTYTTDGNALRAIEPNVVWTTTDAKVQGVMAVTGGTPAGSAVVLVSTASSGRQFCIMNVATDQAAAVNGQTQAGTYYKLNTTTFTTPPTTVTFSQCGTSGYTRDQAAGWATS
jgi:type IV pilus assembly protein PilA